LALVSALRIVDVAEIAYSNDVKPFIEKYGVDVIVHGDDWEHQSYMRQIAVTQEYLDNQGVEIVYVPYYKPLSTSKIIQDIRDADEVRSA
jgi:glycerol-3-phosphate cytidylyltransferase